MELMGNELITKALGTQGECFLQPSMNGTDGGSFRALQADIMNAIGLDVKAPAAESLHGTFNCSVAGVPAKLETADLLLGTQPGMKPELAPGMKPS